VAGVLSRSRWIGRCRHGELPDVEALREIEIGRLHDLDRDGFPLSTWTVFRCRHPPTESSCEAVNINVAYAVRQAKDMSV
jgi:hypothetical protein